MYIFRPKQKLCSIQHYPMYQTILLTNNKPIKLPGQWICGQFIARQGLGNKNFITTAKLLWPPSHKFSRHVIGIECALKGGRDGHSLCLDSIMLINIISGTYAPRTTPSCNFQKKENKHTCPQQQIYQSINISRHVCVVRIPSQHKRQTRIARCRDSGRTGINTAFGPIQSLP